MTLTNLRANCYEKSPEDISFTVIRKYLQQLIINADKQGANKSREHSTFIRVCSLLFCYAIERHF